MPDRKFPLEKGGVLAIDPRNAREASLDSTLKLNSLA